MQAGLSLCWSHIPHSLKSHVAAQIIPTVILLPTTDSRRVFVSYKRKYVHKVLVNSLVKLAKEKSVVRLTDRPDMTIAVDWDVKNQTKTKEINMKLTFVLFI